MIVIYLTYYKLIKVSSSAYAFRVCVYLPGYYSLITAFLGIE